MSNMLEAIVLCFNFLPAVCIHRWRRVPPGDISSVKCLVWFLNVTIGFQKNRTSMMMLSATSSKSFLTTTTLFTFYKNLAASQLYIFWGQCFCMFKTNKTSLPLLFSIRMWFNFLFTFSIIQNEHTASPPLTHCITFIF